MQGIRDPSRDLPSFDPKPIQFQIRAPFIVNAPAGDEDHHQQQQQQQADPRPQLVTLATQTSLDRWPAAAQQARAWGGPVSIAVYSPCPPESPGAEAAEQLVVELAGQYGARHPQQHVVVSLLYAWHYAREGAGKLPQVRLRGLPCARVFHAALSAFKMALLFL